MPLVAVGQHQWAQCGPNNRSTLQYKVLHNLLSTDGQ